MTVEVPSEDQEQARFVAWFRRTYPGVLIFAIPNGGHRHIATATRLKATGAVRGIPDLYIPAWRVWVEMKRQKGGRLSEEQRQVIAYLTEIEYTVIVAHGCADAIAHIEVMTK